MRCENSGLQVCYVVSSGKHLRLEKQIAFVFVDIPSFFSESLTVKMKFVISFEPAVVIS
jgi:hypothetical protein